MGRENRDQPPAMAETRRLIADIKVLHREAESLRVRCWQGEDRVAELEDALCAAEAQHQELLDRLRELQTQIAALRCFAGGAPVECGFRLGEGAKLAGSAVRRTKTAPSATMIFGPYVRLRPGRYAATVTARLYEPVAVPASFAVEVVCGGGQHVIAVRHFQAWPLLPARPRRLIFTVPDGLDRDDFEVRIWARRGTPLEISRIALHPLSATTAFPAPDSTIMPAGATA
jgi:hypothetical protein